MEHCFDIGPSIILSKLSGSPVTTDDIISIIDPVSELIAKVTKQLIQTTSGDFIDIGAYKGKWTDYVYNNCLDVNRRIILFEPCPPLYTDLVNKYKLTKRIQYSNLAITSKRGNIVLIEDAQSSEIYRDNETYFDYQIRHTVPGVTYDGLFKNKKVSIVKIRANGHECHILSGMQETLQENNIEAIIFEFTPHKYGYYKNALLIEKYLLSLIQRFQYVYVLEREHLKITRLESAIDVFDFIQQIAFWDTYDCFCAHNPIIF
jgi:FkbM family methyltransferase